MLKKNKNVSLCRLILEREGPRSLFRGLGPNLVGVAPSRYARFYLRFYVQAQRPLNSLLSAQKTTTLELAFVNLNFKITFTLETTQHHKYRRGSMNLIFIYLAHHKMLH